MDTDDRRTVLVTGAAQGLGLQMTTAFLRDGCRVAMADRNEGELARAAAPLLEEHADGAVTALPVDVTDDASVQQMVDGVQAWAGRLDVLVNNAGVISRSPSEAMPTEVWLRELDVNVGGTFRCSRAAFPLLRASAYPSIINLGSLGSSLGMPMRVAYNTSKTGIVGLTRTLAAEWGALGIRVNAIAPGFIEKIGRAHV